MSLFFHARLPAPLCHLIHARMASSQSQNVAFPFPRHSNPSPHEIFHLPRGASQSDIKLRYYELVRIYHPDCSTARTLEPATSHSQFQAISDAYGVLTGKKTSRTSFASDAPYEAEVLRRKRAQWRSSASSDEFGYGAYGGSASSWAQQDREKWDRGLLILIVVFALSSTIIPVSLLSPFATNNTNRRHEDARKHLANARREARELASLHRLRKKAEDGDEPNLTRQTKVDDTLTSEAGLRR